MRGKTSSLWVPMPAGYKYVGGLPEGHVLCLGLNGTTISNNATYRIYHTYLRTTNYLVLKQRTQWTISAAKSNAEKWIEENLQCVL